MQCLSLGLNDALCVVNQHAPNKVTQAIMYWDIIRRLQDLSDERDAQRDRNSGCWQIPNEVVGESPWGSLPQGLVPPLSWESLMFFLGVS